MIMESLGAKRLIPFHWETWGNVASDPGEVEWVFAKRNPNLKAIIMQPGGMIMYPKDRDIGRYRYPDWRDPARGVVGVRETCPRRRHLRVADGPRGLAAGDRNDHDRPMR